MTEVRAASRLLPDLLLAAAHRRLEVLAERVDRLGDDRVEDGVGEARRLAGAEGPELELVAGEGERARPVAVAAVLRQARQDRGAQVHQLARRARGGGAAAIASNDVLELGAEEDRDDRRRRLVRAEPVVLAGAGDRRPQQLLVLVHGHDDGGREEQELQVLARACRWAPAGSPPVSVPIDQLLCLPEPFTPANGFSWRRHTRS